MYPDTDSPPIPLENEHIESLGKNLPGEVIDYYKKMKAWDIPEDTYTYILRKNLFPLIERIVEQLKIDPKFTGIMIGQRLNFIEGQYNASKNFEYNMIFELFKRIRKDQIHPELAYSLLAVVYQHPEMMFGEMLNKINFKKLSEDEILSKIPEVKSEFSEIRISKNSKAERFWIMGKLSKIARGNIALTELSSKIGE